MGQFVRKLYMNRKTFCVSLPSDLIRKVNLHRGDYVRVSVDQLGRIIVAKIDEKAAGSGEVRSG